MTWRWQVSSAVLRQKCDCSNRGKASVLLSKILVLPCLCSLMAQLLLDCEVRLQLVQVMFADICKSLIWFVNQFRTVLVNTWELSNTAYSHQIKPFKSQLLTTYFVFFIFSHWAINMYGVKVQGLMCPVRTHISIGLLIWWWPIRSLTSSVIVCSNHHSPYGATLSLPSFLFSSNHWCFINVTPSCC